MQVHVTPDPLSVDVAYRAVVREDCGAVSLFTGTVRSPNDGKRVIEIDYSAFAEMAENRLTVLTEDARKAEESDRQAAEASLAEAYAMSARNDASAETRRRAVKRAKVQLKLLQ